VIVDVVEADVRDGHAVGQIDGEFRGGLKRVHVFNGIFIVPLATPEIGRLAGDGIIPVVANVTVVGHVLKHEFNRGIAIDPGQ
jgi:hypothetical protein